MKYAKQQLAKYQQTPLMIDEKLLLQNLIDERFSDLIISARSVQVQGTIRSIENEDIVLAVSVVADLTLPSSRSLAPVDWSIELPIHETYISDEERLKTFEDEDAVFVLENNSIDLDQVVLDNLVAALPSQILTKDEENEQTLPTGKDWQVISEEDFAEQEAKEQKESQADEKQLDPRLAKLDDFFK
ncbi:YceD family protein [Fructobacillus ficulneus]|uniref:DUF177 domain-containing protein n=1 Tax=Fructobacillus ficulneus TaxID=157463 RepID=A0A0K8MIP1_9LACO|nr:YceD family protein [Fructobacillus ficulneus]GAO99749.1 hypothetical protein FFIC_240220 [Fructobacillus ficulneus]